MSESTVAANLSIRSVWLLYHKKVFFHPYEVQSHNAVQADQLADMLLL